LTDPIRRLEEIIGPVSRETIARLESFAREFARWQPRINLASASTTADLWERHILDSAQLLRRKPEARNWVDLGSGGGFPGAVLAILLAERPDATVHLVDSNAKKAAFLNAALAAAGVSAHIHRCRIEDAFQRVGPVDIVTARALAPLDKLLALAAPWMRDGATGLFHKGRDFMGELDRARGKWRFELVEHASVVDAEGVILEITRLRPLQAFAKTGTVHHEGF
jgi:16S rRNA (guanine527-N7)-methyltransferase